MRLWHVLFLLLLYHLLCAPPPAECDSCPGWPCSSNADCDVGSGCACAGTQTGPGYCVR